MQTDCLVGDTLSSLRRSPGVYAGVKPALLKPINGAFETPLFRTGVTPGLQTHSN
jgi:hypothetical protein